jgi:hypothetical protein
MSVSLTSVEVWAASQFISVQQTRLSSRSGPGEVYRGVVYIFGFSGVLDLQIWMYPVPDSSSDGILERVIVPSASRGLRVSRRSCPRIFHFERLYGSPGIRYLLADRGSMGRAETKKLEEVIRSHFNRKVEAALESLLQRFW